MIEIGRLQDGFVICPILERITIVGEEARLDTDGSSDEDDENGQYELPAFARSGHQFNDQRADGKEQCHGTSHPEEQKGQQRGGCQTPQFGQAACQPLVDEKKEREKEVGDKSHIVVIDVEETIADEDDRKDGKRQKKHR